MRDEVIVGSSVAAIADPVAVGDLKNYSFTIHAGHFANHSLPRLSASGITGAEEVTLWTLTDGTWVKVFHDGEVVKLTATSPQHSILTEGVYAVTKTSGTGIKVTVQMP